MASIKSLVFSENYLIGNAPLRCIPQPHTMENEKTRIIYSPDTAGSSTAWAINQTSVGWVVVRALILYDKKLPLIGDNRRYYVGILFTKQ